MGKRSKVGRVQGIILLALGRLVEDHLSNCRGLVSEEDIKQGDQDSYQLLRETDVLPVKIGVTCLLSLLDEGNVGDICIHGPHLIRPIKVPIRVSIFSWLYLGLGNVLEVVRYIFFLLNLEVEVQLKGKAVSINCCGNVLHPRDKTLQVKD